MKSTLFIITEDLNNGVIKSQVFSHIDFLKKKRISDSTVFFCYWNKIRADLTIKNIQLIQSKYGINIYPIRIFSPSFLFSNYLNQRIILENTQKLNVDFDYIHARTDLCAVISKKIKERFNSKLIWDCRGYAPAEVDYEKINFKNIKKFYLKMRFNKASKLANKVIVVSTKLEKLVKEQGNINTYKIPSVATRKLFFFDLKKRKKMRKELNFTNSSTVFVYSGSLKSYQMINETISFFRAIYLKNKNCFLIILTNDLDQAKKNISGKNIIFFSVDQIYVNDYLNASDFAIMIRKKDLTNEVASPTKFSEYCLSGLSVITNSSVIDFYKYKKKINNILELDNFKILKVSNKKRKTIADFYKLKLSRESFSKKIKDLYA